MGTPSSSCLCLFFILPRQVSGLACKYTEIRPKLIFWFQFQIKFHVFLLEVGGKTGIPWFSFVLVRTVVLFHCTSFYGTYRQSPL